MTKEEQNDIIKQVWTRNLRKDVDIPENISEIYINWVQSKVLEASQQMSQNNAQSEQQQPAQQQQQTQ